MSRSVVRYAIDEAVPVADAEAALHLAIVAAEGLYGPARLRINGAYSVDPVARAIAVDEAFKVRRVRRAASPTPETEP